MIQMHIAIIMTIIMMEAVATTTSIMMVSVGMIIATATENAMRLRFPGLRRRSVSNLSLEFLKTKNGPSRL